MYLGQGEGATGGVGMATERGYAMAALLVGLSIMAVLMSMALPVWSQMAKREKEIELIWRGEQYARAIGLFQRRYANTFPPTVDILVEQRFLRKKYKDPMTGEDFQPIPAGGGVGAPGQQPGQPPAQGGSPGQQQPGTMPIIPGGGGMISGRPPAQGGGTIAGPSIGIQGVVSKSSETSIKIYNGRTKYNEWAFVYMPASRQMLPGAQPPGAQPIGPGNRAPGQRPGEGMMPFGPPGMRPEGQGPRGRPPVPGGGPGSPFGQPPSPFGPPPPFGAPPQRPQRPPG